MRVDLRLQARMSTCMRLKLGMPEHTVTILLHIARKQNDLSTYKRLHHS